MPQTLSTGGSRQIADISSDFWFSPLQPLSPMAPSDQRPRQWAYPPGANLIWQPKGNEELGFAILREFADSCDLLRLVLETVKDRLSAAKWEIRLIPDPDEPQKALKERQKKDPRIAALTDFFKKPDGVWPWSKWVKMLLEDMLVLDAGCVYKERDLKGRIASLRLIDGATITRYITEQGFTPAPPSTAYAQILYGIPSFDMTTDDLTYVMRNPRTWRRYGSSPVEQNLTYIGIALRRQDFLSKYYTDGNIPEALCFLPSDLPIDRVKEIQDWFDSVLAGDLAKRRRLTFLPGYGSANQNTKPNVLFPKEALLKDPLDEWLFQMFCYNLGTSPQAMLRMMNRATAQQSAETAEEEGLEPKLNELAEIMTGIIQYDLGMDDIEFTYSQRRETDILKQSQVDVAYVNAGIKARNEVREYLGLDPDESEMADNLCITTASGVVPIDTDDQVDQIQATGEARAALQPEPTNGNGNGKPKPGKKKAQPQTLLTAGDLSKADVSIDPSHTSTATHEAQTRLEKALLKVFRRQKDKAKDEADRLMKARRVRLRKDDEKTPEQVADELYAKIVDEFRSVPVEAAAALEAAAIEGVSRGILQIEVSDAGMIAAVNSIARDWAHERGAELVGMRFDDEGNLVENPDAEWAISESTRDELRRIVQESFEGETKYADLVELIQDAGAFSDSRAAMIARTEVARAQTQGNWEVWKASGLVLKVRWQVSDDNPCDICAENDDEIRPLGEAFPSGATMPLQHPNCACILVIEEFNE